jgi:hypothetical protein
VEVFGCGNADTKCVCIHDVYVRIFKKLQQL